MFGLSIWHIVVIGVVVFLLFGGRISSLMGAAGKSLRSGEGPVSQVVPSIIPRIIKTLFP
jgi:Sec-independent protein translocase protein TatA